MTPSRICLGLPADEEGLLPACGVGGSSRLAGAGGAAGTSGLALVPQLAGLPKGVSQHPGGMLVISTPLTDLMPVQPSAIADCYVAQWDKDSVDDAGVV